MNGPLNLSIQHLLHVYRGGTLRPAEVIAAILERTPAHADDHIWIRPLSPAELRPYLERLDTADSSALPLYGIPFAIKDNIDLAGVPTTAACPDYAYAPTQSAQVVHRLVEAGAVPIGKTNLDQFATGLVGTRSPYGATRNAFDPAYISGGSSSGSALAVAKGLASFALGTDTAGSGRVPAAFNNLVGIKPTRGLVSTRGVVPACRTLDCVSVFALDVADAQAALAAVTGFDPEDPFSRKAPHGPPAHEHFRFGVPARLELFGDAEAARLFAGVVAELERLGGQAVAIDFTPFRDAARLLYEGPWVAERYAAIQRFIEAHPQALLPVTRDIIEPAIGASAVSAFQAQYRLAALKRQADALLAELDFVLTPTTGTIYRIDAVEADPIRLNSRLGLYTNFMNLLDYAAVAVPAGFGANGLPYGVTLFGPAFSDDALAVYGDRLHRALDLPLGATGRKGGSAYSGRSPQDAEPLLRVAVCGAHLSGLPLNHQLSERGGRLVAATRTAPRYRLFALPGGPPSRPGLVRQTEGGASVEVEVWELPAHHFGSFVAGIPAPLGIGTVELADGSLEKGFICEGYAVEGARDITDLGGWRAYLATMPAGPA
jgi:allophanate hydrolase